MPPPSPAMTIVVTARNLRKAYGKTVALDNTSFEIDPGSIIGLIGPNGAGKTTALKAMLGLTPFEGELKVLGRDPRTAARRTDERCLLHRRRRGAAALDPGLARRSNSSPACIRASTAPSASASSPTPSSSRAMRVRELSKGMIVQLHLALVMAIDARLLVLDEPTLGLDILYRKQFYQRLLEDYFDEQKTIIITTHQVEEIEHILTDVMFIRDGKIVLDAPMDAVGERFVEVLVNADQADDARALKPIDERALPFGKTVMLFDGVPQRSWPRSAKPAPRAWPTCSSPP